MSVTDIINRADQEYSVEEMQRVVEFYVYKRIGKTVVINVDSMMVFPAAYIDQVQKLSYAFDVAKNYLLNLW
jgi:hypothetical protein